MIPTVCTVFDFPAWRPFRQAGFIGRLKPIPFQPRFRRTPTLRKIRREVHNERPATVLVQRFLARENN